MNTTHDWATTVDKDHLDHIRRHADEYTGGSALHLALEVMAYANDEAESLERRVTCVVGTHVDGSLSIADDGRGTDTRRDTVRAAIKKPVISTKDLRFFDAPQVVLPDGLPRRGMSVVAALSDWLIHINRRTNGAWSQRYEGGMPVTDLVPIELSERSGTTVRFLVSHAHVPPVSCSAEDLREKARFPWLDVTID